MNALNELGYSDVYHMRSVFRRQHADLWTAALEAKFEGKGKAYGKEEWEKLFGDCMVCASASSKLPLII